LNNKKIIISEDSVELYIDQRETNKFLRKNFENYLQSNLKKWENNNIKIKIKVSHTKKCLQAVDFISWSVFRKYERNDYEYYELIKDKIIEENLLFP